MADLAEEAHRKLRAAMAEYRFTDRDRIRAPHHIIGGTDCWCHPEKRYEHGELVLIHKRPA